MSSISSELNGCLSSSTRPSSALAAEKRRERVADQLVRGRAQQSAHPRADVGDAVLGIDLPQPADAALLIFLEQQAGALALAADIGVGLELVERPAGDGQHAEDRDSEREQDREHVLEGDRMAADEQSSADAGGKRRPSRR